MQHTKRYLLVPEEIYASLSQPSTLDGTPVGLVRSRIQQTKNEGDEINYQQEFKRLSKLSKEDEERPVDVRLQNLEEVLPKQIRIQKKAKNEDDEDEVWEDASPRNLRSSKTSASSERPDANYPMTKYGILEHIRQNASGLGVSEDGKILKADGNLYKTSNIDDIVVHLLNKDKRMSFTSVEPLLREAKARNKQITRREVQNFLATQRSYTLHRQAKRRYRRLPTLAPGLHTEWQADLAIKNLYKLLGEGSEPLAEKVRTAQNAYTYCTSVASKWARQEYINRRTTREKRSVVDEDEQLQKALDTLTDFYGEDEEGSDLKLLGELEQTKLKEEIARMHKDDRAILDSTKEVGMEAWIQAYRKVQPSFNMSLYKSLEKQPATYAVRKTEIKSSFISAGRYEFEYNVFSATIPRRMTIGMPRVYADWQRELLVAAYEAHGRYLSMPHARQLALQTRLTTKQVTKWFCNRRLRRR
ncbi:hypothetical protein GPALN_003079 [Globodera pallida]|nr:hypothetical protein GPALN_003079 [Globodera pallida]